MEADVRGQREQISRWEVRWRFLFFLNVENRVERVEMQERMSGGRDLL